MGYSFLAANVCTNLRHRRAVLLTLLIRLAQYAVVFVANLFLSEYLEMLSLPVLVMHPEPVGRLE